MNLGLQVARFGRLCFGILLLPVVARQVILDLQFLRPHKRMEMKFAQLVLFDKGLKSDSEPSILVRRRTLEKKKYQNVGWASLQFVHLHIDHLFLRGVFLFLVPFQFG